MKKKIAEKWTKALRSGKYKQGRHALKYKTKASITRHCCLGVLCELYQKDHKRKIKTEILPGKGELRGSRVTAFDMSEGTLPDAVIKWSGIMTEDGMLPDELNSLASLNDDGMTFRQIADIIDDTCESI